MKQNDKPGKPGKQDGNKPYKLNGRKPVGNIKASILCAALRNPQMKINALNSALINAATK